MITLNGITWQNPRGYDPLVAGARAWMESHPEVRVSWTQEMWYRFEQIVLGNSKETFDLLMFDHPWTGTLARDRRLVAWDTLVPAEYLDSLRRRVLSPSVESYERDNHLWALPLDAACHAALYREDLILDNRLPLTWEQVAGWAKEHHDPPHRYGLVLCVGGVQGHCLFLSMMASLGFPAYQDPERPTCDRAAAEHVLTTLRKLLTFGPPGSTHWEPWDIYEHFTSKDDVAYSPSIFAYVNYFGGSGRNNLLRLSRVPGFEGRGPGRPILGGVGLGISASCPFIQDARDFAVFLMDDSTQKNIFPRHSGQPAAKAAWDDPELNERTNGFYQELALNMASAYVRPTYTGFHQHELEGGKILQDWCDGKASLADTLSRLRAC